MMGELINGAEALLEGFGRNPPSKEVAQGRADVCLHSGPKGERCPYNHIGGWTVTTAIGAVIQAQREKKHQLKLKVDGEESLGVCKICRCPMFLKIFYDWDTIYSHTSDDKFREFREKWPSCWMVKELDQHHKPKTP